MVKTHLLIVASTAFAALLASGSPSPARPAAAPGPAQGAAAPLHQLRHLRTIALDPGHGGDNRGCLGVDGTREKAATLEIARRVARILLEETTATPLLTRDSDRALGLRERSELANSWDADVFLSIHLNADPFGQGFGVETWFLAPALDAEVDVEAHRLVAMEEAAYNETADIDELEAQAAEAVARDASIGASRAASEPLAEAVVRALSASTGAAMRGVRQARFGVLKAAAMPAIVVECGFFTHAEEGMRLRRPDYLEQVARGIVDGLIAYDRAIGGVPTATR